MNPAAQDLPAKFDPARDPAKDVAAAATTAQGKRVIVDVGGQWCAWCHILDRDTAALQRRVTTMRRPSCASTCIGRPVAARAVYVGSVMIA